jgi:hypothetical protein
MTEFVVRKFSLTFCDHVLFPLINESPATMASPVLGFGRPPDFHSLLNVKGNQIQRNQSGVTPALEL